MDTACFYFEKSCRHHVTSCSGLVTARHGGKGFERSQVNLAGLLAANDFTLVSGALVTRYKQRSLAPVATRAPTWLGIQTEQIVNG